MIENILTDLRDLLSVDSTTGFSGPLDQLLLDKCRALGFSLFILYYAVNVGGEWTVTKAWATLSDAGKWNILWTSVVMALKTTLICLLLGYPIAYILSNMKKTVAGLE